ncbi:MAG: hypothetical protein WAN43_00570 [Rhodomicrobium sp.]
MTQNSFLLLRQIDPPRYLLIVLQRGQKAIRALNLKLAAMRYLPPAPALYGVTVMHFLALVISDEKPTEALLKDWVSPFMPEKLDRWALGGRYTGLLEPLQLTDTITGGPDCPAIELALSSVMEKAAGGDVKVMRPGMRGPGVDALRVGNLKSSAAKPSAILKGGRWFEQSEEAQAACLLLRNSRLFANVQLTNKQRSAMDIWDSKIHELVSDVRLDQWFSAIDCHV